MDIIDVGETILKTAKRIEKGVDSLHILGKNYAAAEQEYRKALAKEILELRDCKIPVSIINDLARGSENVSDLKFKRDLAEQSLDISKKMLSALQSELSALQSIYKFSKEV